jgi:hypothetical protein
MLEGGYYKEMRDFPDAVRLVPFAIDTFRRGGGESLRDFSATSVGILLRGLIMDSQRRNITRDMIQVAHTIGMCQPPRIDLFWLEELEGQRRCE